MAQSETIISKPRPSISQGQMWMEQLSPPESRQLSRMRYPSARHKCRRAMSHSKSGWGGWPGVGALPTKEWRRVRDLNSDSAYIAVPPASRFLSETGLSAHHPESGIAVLLHQSH